MVDSIGDRVLVREFDDGRDIEVVGKLEKNCEIGSNNKGTSIFTYNTIDPLCRIRFFPLHLMLVSESLIVITPFLYYINCQLPKHSTFSYPIFTVMKPIVPMRSLLMYLYTTDAKAIDISMDDWCAWKWPTGSWAARKWGACRRD